jgi:hypothetical protein
MSITEDAIRRAQNSGADHRSPGLVYDTTPCVDQLPDFSASNKRGLMIAVGLMIVGIIGGFVWIQFLGGRAVLISALGGETRNHPENVQLSADSTTAPEPMDARPREPFATLPGPDSQPTPAIRLPAVREPSAPPVSVSPSFGPRATTEPAASPTSLPGAATGSSASFALPSAAQGAMAQREQTELTNIRERESIVAVLQRLDIATPQKIGSAWVVKIDGRFIAESGVVDLQNGLSVKQINATGVVFTDTKGRVYPVQLPIQ